MHAAARTDTAQVAAAASRVDNLGHRLGHPGQQRLVAMQEAVPEKLGELQRGHIGVQGDERQGKLEQRSLADHTLLLQDHFKHGIAGRHTHKGDGRDAALLELENALWREVACEGRSPATGTALTTVARATMTRLA